MLVILEQPFPCSLVFESNPVFGEHDGKLSACSFNRNLRTVVPRDECHRLSVAVVQVDFVELPLTAGYGMPLQADRE